MAKRWLLSIVAFALACTFAAVQGLGVGYRAPEYRTIDFAWIREPWTGSSKPYAVIREEVERLPKSKLAAAQMEAKLKAQRASRDARLQFRWASIALRLQAGSSDRIARRKALACPAWPLRARPLPFQFS